MRLRVGQLDCLEEIKTAARQLKEIVDRRGGRLERVGVRKIKDSREADRTTAHNFVVIAIKLNESAFRERSVPNRRKEFGEIDLSQEKERLAVKIGPCITCRQYRQSAQTRNERIARMRARPEANGSL